MTWTAILLGLAACIPAIAADETCLDPLFSCETPRGKAIRICAVEEEPGRRWSHLQYRFGQIDAPELVYPPTDGKGQLFFSHVSRKGQYEVTVRFTNGGYTYRVVSSANDKGEGAAGVIVSAQNGRRIATIDCTERPYMFPSYLQRALACDLTNPYGRAACGDKPFEVR